MNYSSDPGPPSFLPEIHPDVEPYYRVALLLFTIVFFISVHYRMHVIQHLVPPFYVMWLQDRLRSFLSRWHR